jgi:hypothetical protein
MRIITNSNKKDAALEIIEAILDYDAGCTLGGPKQPKITINPATGMLFIPMDDDEIQKIIINSIEKNITKKQCLMAEMPVMTTIEQYGTFNRRICTRYSRHTGAINWPIYDLAELDQYIADPLLAVSMVVYDPNGLLIVNQGVASGRLMPILNDITIYSNFIKSDIIFAPKQKYQFGLELIKQTGNFVPFSETDTSFFVHDSYFASEGPIHPVINIVSAVNIPVRPANQPPSDGRCTICHVALYDYYVGLLDPALLIDASTKHNHVVVCHTCMHMKFIKFDKIMQSGNGVSPLTTVFRHYERKVFPFGALKFPNGIHITNKTTCTTVGVFLRLNTEPPVLLIPGGLKEHYEKLYEMNAFNIKIMQVKIAF